MSDDLERLAADLGGCLQRAGHWLSTAESCTGGWIAKCVTDVAGSSAWFDRGVVTYSNEAKQELLGVQAATLSAEGAVSEAVAREMARGALERSGASLAVAVTGIAGPGGGSAAKPIGMVCFGWALPARLESGTCVFSGDRLQVRQQAVEHALQGLLRRCGC